MSYEIVFTPAAPTLAAVEVGSTASVAVRAKKKGGPAPDGDVTLSVSGAGFSVDQLGPHPVSQFNGGLDLQVSCAPGSGTQTGTLTATWAGGSSSCTLEATGLDPLGPPTVEGALDFGTLDVDASSDMSVTVRVPPQRAGSTSNESCTVTASISGAGYTVSPAGAQTVAAGAALSLTVTFSPTAAQDYPATLSVAWERGGASGTPIDVTLTGAGLDPLGPPTVEGGPLDFGTLEVDASSGQPVTVRVPPQRTGSTLDESCTVTASVSGAGYTVSPGGAQSVAAGGTQVLMVTFSPLAADTYPATLSVAWERGGVNGTPIDVALTGTGRAPPPPDPGVSVTLPASHPFPDTYVHGRAAAGSVMLTGTTDLEVDISTTGDFATSLAPTQTIPAGGLQIPLEFEPAAAGERLGELIVSWAGGRLSARLSGNGLLPKAPKLDTTTHDYGTTVVGVAAPSFTFIVENPMDAENPAGETLEITPRPRPGGFVGFTVSPTASATHDEGVDAPFVVTFKPPAPGPHTGTLDLDWERAGETGTFTITVSGVGEDFTDRDGGDNQWVRRIGLGDVGTFTHQGDGTGLTQTAQAGGDGRRRAGWYVPSWRSYLSLGAPWSPLYAPVSQPGFTATTAGHVFMRAAGTVTFQSECGPVWLQSVEGNLYSVSGGNTYQVAKSSLYLGGGGLVAIMAGYAGAPIAEDEEESYAAGSSPGTPAPINHIPPALFGIDLAWQIADKIVGLASSVYLVWHTKCLGKQKATLARTAMALTVGGQAVGLTSFVMGRAAGSPQKVVNFFSQAGILVGTPAFLSMYGLMGVNYRSANVTLLGNLAAAIDSVGVSAMDSPLGEASVSAPRVSVSCWKGVYLYCTFGAQSLFGWDIKIGGSEPDGMQLPTSTVDFESILKAEFSTQMPQSKLRLAARSLVPVWPDVNTKLNIQSDGYTKAKSPTTKIVIQSAAGPVWTIEASAAGVSIKNKTGEVLNAKTGLLTLGPVGSQITVAAANTSIESTGTSVADAGTTINAIVEAG